MILDYALLSKPGPRKINEDAVVALAEGESMIFAVADGLGGMGSGEVASGIAMECLSHKASALFNQSVSLRQVAEDINRSILAEQPKNIEWRTMATTFTAGVIRGELLTCAHVGDTRLAVARGEGIKRLTKDHSEGQRLYDAGRLSREEFLEYPRSNVLESALGADEKPRIDCIEFKLQVGDVLLGSSDGVHNLVLLREVRRLIDESTSPEVLLSKIDQAVSVRGPEDNYSAIAVWCR